MVNTKNMQVRPDSAPHSDKVACHHPKPWWKVDMRKLFDNSTKFAMSKSPTLDFNDENKMIFLVTEGKLQACLIKTVDIYNDQW